MTTRGRLLLVLLAALQAGCAAVRRPPAYPLSEPVRLDIFWRVPSVSVAGRAAPLDLGTADPAERNRLGDSTFSEQLFYVPSDRMRLTGPAESRVAMAPTREEQRASERSGGRRFGTRDEDLVPLTGGGITITSNRVAGCSLWSWEYDGVDYVNVYDFGRQIQVAMNLKDPRARPPMRNNPTEAGGRVSNGGIPQDYHGSPCLEVRNEREGTASPVQTTIAVPLEWDPEKYGGGPANPVLWRDVRIGKRITLGYRGLRGVARYETIVVVPGKASLETYDPVIEIPSVYLPAEFTDFHQFDATDGNDRPLPLVPGVLDAAQPPSGIGGVIVQTADGAAAFGIYGAWSERGGSVTRDLGQWQYVYFPWGGHGPMSHGTAKFNAGYHGPLKAGENRFTTYLVSGSAAEVRASMRRLHDMGVR